MVIHENSLPDPLTQVKIEDSVQYSNISLLTETSRGEFVPAYLEVGIPLKETDYLSNSQSASPNGIAYDKHRKTFTINSVPNIDSNVVFQIKIDNPPAGYKFFVTNQSSKMRETVPCDPCYLYMMEPAGSMGGTITALFYLRDELSLQFHTLAFVINFVIKRPVFQINYADMLVNITQGISDVTVTTDIIPPNEIVVPQLTNHNNTPVSIRLKAPRDFQLRYEEKNFDADRAIDISIPGNDSPVTHAYESVVKIELIETANSVNKYSYIIKLRFNED
ncbi:hypothetical protein COTS27_01492 [Spirochaetota bacterium]|nr:hypothetical protein COTS27_01492 [Spirochaetota bacterium]